MLTTCPLWDIEHEFQKYPLDYKFLGGRYQVGARQLALRYFIVNGMLCSTVTWHRSQAGFLLVFNIFMGCWRVLGEYEGLCTPKVSVLKEAFKIMHFHFTDRETEGLWDKVASLKLHSLPMMKPRLEPLLLYSFH